MINSDFNINIFFPYNNPFTVNPQLNPHLRVESTPTSAKVWIMDIEERVYRNSAVKYGLGELEWGFVFIEGF